MTQQRQQERDADTVASIDAETEAQWAPQDEDTSPLPRGEAETAVKDRLAELAARWDPEASPAAEPTVPLVAPTEHLVAPTEHLAAPTEELPAKAAPTESIFRPVPGSRPEEAEPTRVDVVSDEERKLAAERAARREARVQALAATAPVAAPAPAPIVLIKPTTDKFFGSLGLLLLRWVTAGILAIRGLNLLTDIPAAQAQFAQTLIPEPQIMAIVTGVAALLIALSLVIGLLTRIAGLGVALIAGGALAFVQWGAWSPFVPGQPGFLGELELLLAAVGLTLMLVGAGGWSLDRSFRAGRQRDKAEKAAAAG